MKPGPGIVLEPRPLPLSVPVLPVPAPSDFPPPVQATPWIENPQNASESTVATPSSGPAATQPKNPVRIPELALELPFALLDGDPFWPLGTGPLRRFAPPEPTAVALQTASQAAPEDAFQTSSEAGPETASQTASEADSHHPAGRWQFWTDSAGELAAAAVRLDCPGGADLPKIAHALYLSLLQRSRAAARPLVRVWNFIPAIHAEVGGLENYRRFNQGRLQAFAEHFGQPNAPAQMPAATGIGVPGKELILIALFDAPGCRHLENPAQIPAWNYPPEHGPAPPAFARATVNASGTRSWLSGTAAVRGHASEGLTLSEQLDLTWANIRAMEAQFPPSSQPQDFTAWVRQPEDAAAVSKSLRQNLPPETRWRVLQAEICRQELLVELEGIYPVP